MLGALSFPHSHPRLQRTSANFGHGRERRPQFLRFSASWSNSNGRNSVFCKRVSLCSVSGGGHDPIQAGKVHAEVGEDGDEVDSKASSAIAPINPRPQDCLTVSSFYS